MGVVVASSFEQKSPARRSLMVQIRVIDLVTPAHESKESCGRSYDWVLLMGPAIRARRGFGPCTVLTLASDSSERQSRAIIGVHQACLSCSSLFRRRSGSS